MGTLDVGNVERTVALRSKVTPDVSSGQRKEDSAGTQAAEDNKCGGYTLHELRVVAR